MLDLLVPVTGSVGPAGVGTAAVTPVGGQAPASAVRFSDMMHPFGVPTGQLAAPVTSPPLSPTLKNSHSVVPFMICATGEHSSPLMLVSVRNPSDVVFITPAFMVMRMSAGESKRPLPCGTLPHTNRWPVPLALS